ncbi:MAG: hypothetical protein A3H69_04015 [Candidatus Sungbacteria bacterium RIFCSPLOWO2_02_FULL_47_9]|uniref:Uncharacterized protein n=1 Tax=Candidatus Sungbacteria bacterium RIFCSPHIGHO2_01_FULL_47_32 TaxID=1802264 RepID=A0A1G2KAD4_9BACT|nr:MAG: hypothetical protein UX72_C0049G0006 [Parcubacteria group bacterium GW2011_GWA2_47_10]OGZ95368.1 MAG: hypothetical protein A2633_04260 [Candidatus Sungbacteria bacterium RIFCSPHIGHO2_01_FULL_47_32]OGZ98865.1 MAG: hypothetical protein A3D57_03915 [Candidatus Sungbacteria bacterium RIFCSPHIGHO2_02_FULL_46_12]OHA05236.1 MAG: hypothetical protein A3A28_04190 [Candidatus Sungbacteria bacterium RIFCSPLOWO2_01_FULL_47_32]OHA10329.1 MAG: hypothetical protein A3H69_04015 [Candidatus Sungbacteria
MTTGQYLFLVKAYRHLLESRLIPKSEAPHDHPCYSKRTAMMHCRAMLDEMENLILADEREKAMRWLGFVQAILWQNECFTLDELKGHNRSGKEPEKK